ncbi:hypothetical protein Tco_1141635, partial [Tanacetum coccineum]
ETMKTGLTTLGLIDENDTYLSPTDLINSDLTMSLMSTSKLSRTLYAGDEWENYINEKLKTLKPHHITATTFKLTLENEVPLTTHMCIVAKLSSDPIKSLFPPFGEVNADDSADKSLSGTSVQPVTQPKAPTDKRSKKKKNPSSSHLRTFKIIRESSPLTQAIDSQHAEEIMVTADPHQSLDASESAEDQGN